MTNIDPNREDFEYEFGLTQVDRYGDAYSDARDSDRYCGWNAALEHAALQLNFPEHKNCELCGMWMAKVGETKDVPIWFHPVCDQTQKGELAALRNQVLVLKDGLAWIRDNGPTSHPANVINVAKEALDANAKQRGKE